MIPFFEIHTVPIGPISIQAWGTMVALGFLAAIWAATRRSAGQGIDHKHVWEVAPWILLSAFVSARLFHVLFYDLGWYLVHPWDAINPALPGFSMMGGLLGGLAAGLAYVWRKKMDAWKMADLVAYVLPLGTGIGRIGCFLIHDHPGTFTDFFLGVNYPDGVRHDHGLYLSLLGWAMFIAFIILGKKPRKEGFFAGWFLVGDGVVRFGLDFYRIGDMRYGGLTPTQWLLFLSVGLGIWILAYKRAKLDKA